MEATYRQLDVRKIEPEKPSLRVVIKRKAEGCALSVNLCIGMDRAFDGKYRENCGVAAEQAGDNFWVIKRTHFNKELIQRIRKTRYSRDMEKSAGLCSKVLFHSNIEPLVVVFQASLTGPIKYNYVIERDILVTLQVFFHSHWQPIIYPCTFEWMADLPRD